MKLGNSSTEEPGDSGTENNYLIYSKMDLEKLKTCVEACEQCATDCDTCSTDCKEEKGHEHCVIECNSCANTCREFIKAFKSGDDVAIKAAAKKCADACETCAAECAKHSHMDCCKKCADSCRKCAELCKSLCA